MPLTQEKNPYTLIYFHVQWGCAGTDRSAHVPLKKSYTREKSLHIISMLSGAVQGQIGVPMCP